MSVQPWVRRSSLYTSVVPIRCEQRYLLWSLLSPLRFRCGPQRYCNASRQQQRHATTTANNTQKKKILSKEEKEIIAAQRAAYEFYANRRSKSMFSWFGGRRQQRAANRIPLTSDQKNVNTAWYALAIALGALGATYAAVPLYKVFCQTTGFGGTTQRVRIVSASSDNDNTTDESNNNMTTYSSMSTSMLESSIRWMMEMISPVIPAIVGSGTRVHTWTDDDAIERLKQLKPVTNADLITIRFDTTVTDTMPWSFVPVQLDVKVVPGETALSFFRVTNHSPHAITGVATYNVHPPKVGLYFQKIQCFCFEEQRLLPGETVDMPVFFFIDPDLLNDPQVSYIKSVTLSYTFFPTDEDDDFIVDQPPPQKA